MMTIKPNIDSKVNVILFLDQMNSSSHFISNYMYMYVHMY